MATIYLLRHGKATFDDEDYDQLDPVGVSQARCVGEALAAGGLREPLLVGGAMHRHHQTLQECAAALGCAGEAAISVGWNEFDHHQIIRAASPGDLSSLRASLVTESDPSRAFQRLFAKAVTRWVSGEFDADYSETWSAFRARVSSALADVCAAARGGRDVLVVTSGGPIVAVVQQLLGLSDSQTVDLNWAIVNGSCTSLNVGYRSVRLSSFNVYQHLEQARAGLVTYR